MAILSILVKMSIMIFTIGNFTNIGNFAKLLHDINWQYCHYWQKRETWFVIIGIFSNIGKKAKLDFSSLAYLTILVKKPNITLQWLAIFPILVKMPTVVFTIGKFTNNCKFAKLLNDNNWQYCQYWQKRQTWFVIIGIFSNIGKKAKRYITVIGNVANVGEYAKH